MEVDTFFSPAWPRLVINAMEICVETESVRTISTTGKHRKALGGSSFYGIWSSEDHDIVHDSLNCGSVRSNRESADRHHSPECPFRWNQNESVFSRHIPQNDFELIRDSEMEEILKVVEFFPTHCVVQDDNGPADDLTMGNESQRNRHEEDTSFCPYGMPKKIKISQTIELENEERIQPSVSEEDASDTSFDSVIVSMNETEEILSRNMVSHASSDTRFTQESLSTASTNDDVIASSSSHTCQAPLSIRSNVKEFKECRKSDQGALEPLRETLRHTIAQCQDRDGSGDSRKRPDNEEVNRSRTGRGQRHDIRNEKEYSEGIIEENMTLVLMDVAEKTHGKTKVEPFKKSGVEKETCGKEDSERTV